MIVDGIVLIIWNIGNNDKNILISIRVPIPSAFLFWISISHYTEWPLQQTAADTQFIN